MHNLITETNIIIYILIFIYILIICYDIYFATTENKYEKKIKYYLGYVKKFYKDRDDSHGKAHVKQVAEISMKYCKAYNFNDNEIIIIILSALLHDAYDHKYVDNIEDVKKDINKVLRKLYIADIEINTIHNIIEDISFSKEKKKRKYSKIEINTFSDKKIQLMRNIVSDADKSTSLGKIAVIRMIQYMNHSSEENYKKYTNEWYDKHINHIIEHCKEKLFILLSHNYIRTDVGRNDCLEKENVLRDIISNRDLLIKYINQYS